MTKYNNILVIQTAFIGDAILASSLLEKLRAYNPAASLSILVRKGNEGIFENHPFLKEVLVWNKKENKLAHLFKMLRRIRGNGYDCVINCHRYGSSGLLTAFSGAKHTAGYKENPFSFIFNTTVRHRVDQGLHEVERYNQLVEDFTDRHIFHPKLYPSSSDHEIVRPLQTRSYVCMAPASVWRTKELPLEKWIELCDSVNAFTKIYLLGAKNDEALCAEIKARSRHADIQILAGKLSLLQSARLMQNAAMNYVNDSAPLHLASSVNAPVTAFFCSTVPDFGFGPLSDTRIVRQVEGLPCKPCGLHGYKACPLGHFKCGHLMDLTNLSYVTMKKIVLPIFCVILLSCSSDDSSEISSIKISQDSSENTAAARDLSAFDYRTMLIEQAGITDEQVLKDITWYTEKDKVTGEVSFKLQLGPNASPYEKEIMDFFEKVVKEKVSLYKEKLPELEDVEVMAEYYIRVIEKGDLDSVWAHRSSNYSRFTSKADLSNILEQRKAYFKPEGTRKVHNRRIAKELGADMKGDFATVTFIYEDGEMEDITLEKEGGRYKILGYHFIMQRAPR